MTAGLGGISPARVRTQNPVLHVIEISIISNVPIKEKMFTVIIQKIFFAHSFEILFYFVSYNVTFIYLFSFLEICTADKDCFGVYKYCDLGICVKGERPLVRDSQR